MPSRHTLWFVALMLPPLSASAAETLWDEIIVRVYDGTGAAPDARRQALTIAGSIISRASVQIVWRTCTASSSQLSSLDSRHTDPCRSPLAPGELAIRIVASGDGVADDRTARPLGEALIDTRTRAGVLATVYADRVEWMAAQTGVDGHELLGKAIAHELGHLLMATSAHGTRGLMRPVWSRSEVRRQHTPDWSFAPREIAVIKARTRARRAAAVTELAVLR
jgi:hypothetical protein